MKLNKQELRELAKAEIENGRLLDVDATWRNMHPVLYKVKFISRVLFTIVFWGVIIGGVAWKGWSFLGSAFEWLIAILVIFSALALLYFLVRGLFMKISTRRKIFTAIFFIMAAVSWLVPFQWSSGFSQVYYIVSFVVLALAMTGD